jgi:hypothetical protein
MGFGISGGNYTTPTGGDGIGTANVGNYNNWPVYKTPWENTTRVLLLFKNNV